MEIVYFDTIDSTHKYLAKSIDDGLISKECIVVASAQTSGVGSRGSDWISSDGNLYCSMAIKKENISKDLPLSAISIYFAFLLAESLRQKGSKLWLKWPNDLYIEDKKIGGMITLIKGNWVVCSFGLNSSSKPSNFGSLDIKICNQNIVDGFVTKLNEQKTWKLVFSKFEIEFELSKKYFAHINEKKISLKNAVLCEDGSLLIENERIYALR